LCRWILKTNQPSEQQATCTTQTSTGDDNALWKRYGKGKKICNVPPSSLARSLDWGRYGLTPLQPMIPYQQLNLRTWDTRHGDSWLYHWNPSPGMRAVPSRYPCPEDWISAPGHVQATRRIKYIYLLEDGHPPSKIMSQSSPNVLSFQK
jgi:hypothetical protein